MSSDATIVGAYLGFKDENRLTLVEYSYAEIDDENCYPGTNELGDGYLIYDGPVAVNSTTFSLSETYDYSYSGDVATDKFYF